jgi:hypothetical protein
MVQLNINLHTFERKKINHIFSEPVKVFCRLEQVLPLKKGYAVGGFNVSNFMGIKRRKIDICKKKNFLQNEKCLKIHIFPHFHLKFAKNAIMSPKIFS